MVESIFDACRDFRAGEASRRERIAAEIRDLAGKLGASAGTAGRWDVTCPHCGVGASFDEQADFLFRPGERACLAVSKIERLVREVLHKAARS